MRRPESRKRSRLMIRFVKLAAMQVVLVAAVAVTVHADPQPLEILRQSILSRTTVDFSGIRTVVVFRDGEKVHGVQQRIDCDAPDRLRILVMGPENQAGKLCLTSGKQHWEYNPATDRVIHAELPSTEQLVQTRLAELARIADDMKMHYVGEEAIAGRQAHVVKVYSQGGVPVKKTWVDTQQYVELKTQRFDSHGQIKSSAYYTRIDFSPTFTDDIFDFEAPQGAKIVEAQRPSERMSLQQAEKKAGFSAVLPNYLPPGYRFCSDRTAVIEVKGKATIWLSFSNGADSFSLFERPAEGTLEPVEHERSITWQHGNYRFTLMGALAHDELLRVKNSIRP
ncbi:MAG: outer membrane lipoprotein-sorting protein [Armatimonadia bacterium]|nr:outer membrane lipoprotein-sorting protein [Armatimonadia bacterium]